MLLRAGSGGVYLDQPRPGTSETTWFFHYFDADSRWGYEPYDKENYEILSNYSMKIFMSGPGPGPGNFTLYEKDHRARLTKTFVRLSA